MLADMVVLSENIFEIAPEKIKEVKVLRTIVNGKEVYKNSP
jgi:predicted amidohydrolase YtcJ